MFWITRYPATLDTLDVLDALGSSQNEGLVGTGLAISAPEWAKGRAVCDDSAWKKIRAVTY